MKPKNWGAMLVVVLSLAILPACTGAQAMLRNSSSNRLNSENEIDPTPTLIAESSGAVKGGSSALAAYEGTLEDIYARVSPSVVNIQVVQKVAVSPSQFPFALTPEEQLQGGEEQYQYSQGSGSGFVWDKEGHIVTNNHVVEGADKIQVIFSDGVTVDATVVGTDPDSDLAVIKVERPAESLVPVALGDSTQLRVGQLAIAIGNPFGLEGTLTTGVVSALGRSLPVDNSSSQTGASYTIPDVIQTDASINPGNSGGVLVDTEGHVIGVTSAIISPVNVSAGIGFAIPSAIVKQVVPSLISEGHYDHPRLGISGMSLVPDLAEAMNLESTQLGALIIEVVPGGPADKAGVRGSDRQVSIDGATARVGGDVVIAIDGEPVKRFEDLPAYLASSTKVGQTIKLTVLRDGKEMELSLTLDARPGTAVATQTPNASTSEGQAYLGIVGSALTPEIANEMDLPTDQSGVLVGQVQQGSPADRAGLRGSYKPITLGNQRVLVGGDVITAMNGTAIADMDTLRAMIQQAHPGQTVTLSILRDGKLLEVNVELTGRPTNP